MSSYYPCEQCGKKPINRNGVIALYRMVINNKVTEVCEACAFKKK